MLALSAGRFQTRVTDSGGTGARNMDIDSEGAQIRSEIVGREWFESVEAESVDTECVESDN